MIWFNSWDSLLRILIIGAFGYMGLVLILRISGSRTLSKMNSFDFVVTIALGSVFAAGLLQQSVSLADVLFGLALLVGLQFLVTFIAVRSSWFNSIIKSSPIVLYAEGKCLQMQMKKAHVTEDEIKAAMRQQGFSSKDQVLFVVLETNGSLIAVGKPKADSEIPESQFTI